MVTVMDHWDIAVGETMLRRELHARWGGGWYGGMEPAVKASSVFLFTKPEQGERYGYNFDGWHPDGTFHYTGDGQQGDQSPTVGGNKALLDAPGLGRTIRLFRSAGRETTYLGAFTLGVPAYSTADAPDRDGMVRSVLVFRLVPGPDVLHEPADKSAFEATSAVELAVEANNIDAYIADRPAEPRIAVRREAELVQQYTAWLTDQGQASVRHRIPIPGGGGYLYTDLFNKSTNEILEAKASSARVYIRAGLGQILDYSRYVSHDGRALLLPSEPAADLIQLLQAHGVQAVWKDGAGFRRSDEAVATP